MRQVSTGLHGTCKQVTDLIWIDLTVIPESQIIIISWSILCITFWICSLCTTCCRLIESISRETCTFAGTVLNTKQICCAGQNSTAKISPTINAQSGTKRLHFKKPPQIPRNMLAVHWIIKENSEQILKQTNILFSSPSIYKILFSCFHTVYQCMIVESWSKHLLRHRFHSFNWNSSSRAMMNLYFLVMLLSLQPLLFCSSMSLDTSIHWDHTLCRPLVLPQQSPGLLDTILDGSPLRHRYLYKHKPIVSNILSSYIYIMTTMGKRVSWCSQGNSPQRPTRPRPKALVIL